jgi:hypothetical protein
MITLGTGAPRAGKTLRAVEWLVKNYFKFDTEKAKYIPKKDDMLIVSNIEGLKVEHKDFDQLLNELNMTVSTFFTEDYQKKVMKKYALVIYLLDEVHKYFPKNFYRERNSNEVQKYFAIHGHYNHHFYLMTQDLKMIWQTITNVAETEIKAVRGTIRPPGMLIYQFCSPGTGIYHHREMKTFRKMRPFMALYQTANRDETEKPKKMYLWYVAGILGILLPYLVYSCVTNPFGLKDKKTKTLSTKNNIENRLLTKGKNIENKNMAGKTFAEKKPIQGLKSVEISFYTIQSGKKFKMFFLNPVDGLVYSADQFPYKIKAKMIIDDKYKIFAMIPENLIPKPKPHADSETDLNLPFNAQSSNF